MQRLIVYAHPPSQDDDGIRTLGERLAKIRSVETKRYLPSGKEGGEDPWGNFRVTLNDIKSAAHVRGFCKNMASPTKPENSQS